MDNHQASVPIFRLKVSLRCCAACPKKAEKKLNKIHGVKSVSINKEEGIVIVSGNVDPKIFIDKFAKWGRKAQLLSFQKDSASNQHLNVDNDFDSDDYDCCHCETNEKENGSDSCQNPSLKNRPKPSEKPDIITSTNKTRKNKFAWFWNLFCMKKKSPSSEFSSVRSPSTAKRSDADMGRYPRPRWPNNNNNNRSPFERQSYGIPGSYNLPYSYQRIMPLSSRPPPPPPPPPYGIYGSMAARNDPQIIHYSNYRDNYFPNPMYYS